MQRTTVESTTLASVGYLPQVATLEIEFLNGAVYQYFAVAQQVSEALLNADSKGAFFNEHIKGKYPFRLTSP